MHKRALLGLAAAAALLGGCATGPYYDDYAHYDGYRDYDRTTYRYYEQPTYRYYEPSPYYYPRYYAGPSVGLSFSYGRHWHRR